MQLHWLQHVPFEGLGTIEEWAGTNGVETSRTRLFAGDPLPAIENFDWLIVMGGPMGIHDHGEYPWLVAEKEFIKAAIDAGKTVLGICLGAQLIADVLGAKVYAGPQKEIGWFPIRRVDGASSSVQEEQRVLSQPNGAGAKPFWSSRQRTSVYIQTPELLPEALTAFHWHSDTFEIPEGATRLASSAACANQGFIYNGRVVGLQFHLETTPASMEALIENCGGELVDAPGIQTADQMRGGLSNLEGIHAAMRLILDTLTTLSGL